MQEEKGKLKTVADIVGEFLERMKVVKNILKKVLDDQRELELRADEQAIELDCIRHRLAAIELTCGRVFEDRDVKA